jgi:hypothetical protein
VTRRSPADIAQREIYISVDGEEMAILRHGDSTTREVAAGAHALRAHNTLFRKAIDVTLGEDEHAQFIVINKAGWGTYTMMTVLGAGPLYLVFERVS